jgi:hypothetical protein
MAASGVIRTRSYLVGSDFSSGIFLDNTSKLITASGLRDFVVSTELEYKSIVISASSYALGLYDKIAVGTASGVLFTLPTASGNTGKQFTIKNGSTIGPVIVSGFVAGQLLDNLDKVTLAQQWQTLDFTAHTSGYYITGGIN